jgi:hypothetical protein
LEIKIDKVTLSKRRTIAFMVTRDAQLIVKAPYFTPLFYIHKIIHEKRMWILKKQKQALENKITIKEKGYINDESFLYLGTNYRLLIVNEGAKVEVCGEYLKIPGGTPERIKQELLYWYKIEALNTIYDKVKYYSQLTGINFRKIRISNAKSRWGSCSYNGNISFSWRLIMAPLPVLEYVVVHELAHILVRGHSKQFWEKVKNIVPDYKEKRKWLRKNGEMICRV